MINFKFVIHPRKGVLNAPCELMKGLAFEKILLPEYQSNDIERCLVLFPIWPIRFSNLPGFNVPFIPVDVSTDSTFRKPAKTGEKNNKGFPLLPFLAMMTLACAHLFCAFERKQSH